MLSSPILLQSVRRCRICPAPGRECAQRQGMENSARSNSRQIRDLLDSRGRDIEGAIHSHPRKDTAAQSTRINI